MSVIHVLENYERKHDAPEDDKAGWKRLIHGAVSKAAGLLWTAGGSVDVTLGPLSTDVMDQLPNSSNFTNIQSPEENYLSASLESESESSEEFFLSLDETSSIRILPVNSNKCPTPKSHSTPYKEKSNASHLTGESSKQISSDVSLTTKKDKGGAACVEAQNSSKTIEPSNTRNTSSQLTDLCSEMERLSLKKMIVEMEKGIAAEVKVEFDFERRKIEEHDRKVAEILSREKEEKGMEEQLMEMNWFQRIRESQLQVEQEFNAKLDGILAKTRKNEPDKKVEETEISKKELEQKDKELDLVAKKRVLIETISNTQKSYNSKYNDLIHLLQSSRVSLVNEFHSDFDSLKTNNARLTDVISKSRCGNVAQEDVDECNRLLNFLSTLFDKIKIKIEEYELAKKLEEEANAKLENALKKNEENARSLASSKVTPEVKEEIEKEEVSLEISSECNERRSDRLKYYHYVTKLLKKAEDSLESFLNDDKYKHFRKDCQRAVNLPVNAISPTSSDHLMDKLNKLSDLLDGKSVLITSRRFTATLHPMGIKYCQILLARKVVKAGEDVVSSHPETGHAIAAVVQSLTIKYPIFTVYLHAFFFKICPYLVPLDLKSSENESGIDFNKRLGFNYENGEIEETDKFLKRMSGVAQLYGAILIAHKRRGDFGMSAPLGVYDLWVWLANFISIDPLPDISATILLDMLEVSGHFMLTSYGYNFQKLLYLICTAYLEKINKVTNKGRGGPVERLKTFLEDVIKINRISSPKGLLPPQFW